MEIILRLNRHGKASITYAWLANLYIKNISQRDVEPLVFKG
nr:hypothetical protein [Providencia vermicola]